MPNDRWDDFAIDKAREADEQARAALWDALHELQRALRDVPINVAEMAIHLEHQGERLDGFKLYISDVEERLRGEIQQARDDAREDAERIAHQCEQLQASMDAEAKARDQREVTVQTAAKQRRTTFVVAIVAGGFTLVASVLGLVGTIVGAK